jgi:hypothetical protein
MVLIFTVFMLLKREDLRNRLLRLAGLGQLNRMTQALDDASGRVSRYLLMQFLVNAGFGTLFGLGLYFIGVPNPALWGVVAGILRIVPYVGRWLRRRCRSRSRWPSSMDGSAAAGVPPGGGSRTDRRQLRRTLALRRARGDLFPGAAGDRRLLGRLWGPAGLILSTPLTVCVVVLGRYVPQLSFLHILLGDEPVLAAEAQIYQRLLAMDQLEAQAILSRFSFREGPGGVVRLGADSGFEHGRTGPAQRSIDAAREEFLFLSINEMVVEFSEYRRPAARR